MIKAAKNPRAMQRKIQLASSLILFGRVCIPEMCTKPSPPFHYKLAKYLTDLSRVLINLVAPRGHAKSSVAACLLVLWHVFLEDLWRFLSGDTNQYIRRKKFVILISKTQGEAIRRLDTIKAILGDENGEGKSGVFASIFGEWGHATARSWTKTEVVLKDGTTFVAKGTGQPFRGLKKVHTRPTLILADDPEDEENTKTIERMDGNLKWLLEAIIPALDSDIGRCIVIGTPQNQSCMVVRLHEAVGWTSAWFSNDLSLNRSSWDGCENYDRKGLLWPELMGEKQMREKLEMARSLGKLSGYYREYETKVVGDEDQLFKPEYFRDYEGTLQEDLLGNHYLKLTHRQKEAGGALIELPEPELIPVNVFMGVDPASSTNRRADYTVIMVIALDRQGFIYVIDYIRRRMPPARVLDAVRNVWSIYKPLRGAVETTQAQEYIPDLLRKEGIFLIGRKPRQGKEERLVRLEPDFSQNKTYTKPEHQEMKSEFMSFPRGRHDDTMDAYDLAREISYKPVHNVIDSEEKALSARKRRTYDPMVA